MGAGILKEVSYETELRACLGDAAIPWDKLNGVSVLVTGATGLIGSCLVRVLSEYAQRSTTSLTIYALVRDRKKAETLLANCARPCNLVLLEGDVCRPIKLDSSVDYIVHAASRTDSAGFVTDPVSVIDTTISGTKSVLEFAKDHGVRGVVFLSTMEVYGLNSEGGRIVESTYDSLDPLSVRNCYPISKCMAENICCAYHLQYGVPVTIARLAQSFGPGVQPGDGRVFSYFARCVLENQDIVLKTKGGSKRVYVYTLDAVSAILILLIKGARGEAYNIANEETYCSIREMAEMVANRVAGGRIAVKTELEDCPQYMPPHFLNLSSAKLRKLGWAPRYSLEGMYRGLVRYFEFTESGKQEA